MSFSRRPGRIATLADRFLRALGLVSGLALALSCGFMVVTVVLRYGFSAGLLGAQELLQMGVALVVFLGLPFCTRTDGHVSVDLVLHALGSRARQWVLRASWLASALAFSLLAWQAAQGGWSAAQWGEATNLMRIPHAPIWFSIAFGAMASALILLGQALGIIGHDAEAGDEDPQ